MASKFTEAMAPKVIEAAQIIIVVSIAWVLVVALLTLFKVNVPSPAPALEAWTKWVASVVAIIVSARVLWAASLWIAKRG